MNNFPLLFKIFPDQFIIQNQSGKICHWSESQPPNSRPQPGTTEISVMLASQIIKESTSFSSSTRSTSPLFAQPKSSPSATRQNNSRKLDVKFWLAQSIRNSPTWSTHSSQENKEVLELWKSHWFLISTKISQEPMDVFVKTEKKEELRTEPHTLLTETESWSIHQSTTFLSEEIPMNIWDWLRPSNLSMSTEKSAQLDGNPDKSQWSPTQSKTNTRKSLVMLSD